LLAAFVAAADTSRERVAGFRFRRHVRPVRHLRALPKRRASLPRTVAADTYFPDFLAASPEAVAAGAIVPEFSRTGIVDGF